ncbi:MAG: MFS transporter [Candidatus Aenigmarchaeota archaeon]|nr:MFS transporter [Candidatus Aenigmarchaeota archaeon]
MIGRLGGLAKGIDDPNYRRALVILFFFALFFSFISFALPIHLSAIGLNGYEIGVLVSLYAIASIFVTFPTGVINDKWTIRLTMVAGIMMLTVFLFSLSLLDSFIIFLPLFFMGGLGYNLSDVSLRTLVYKTKTQDSEGRKFGAYNLVKFISSSFGLLAGGIMAYLIGFRAGFIIIGLVYICLIPFASFKSHSKYKINLSDYKKDVINIRVLSLGVVMFLNALHWGAENTSFGLFLRNNLGFDMLMVGMFTAFSLPFLGIMAYVFGKRIDAGKNSVKWILFFGLLLSGVSFILQTIPIPWFSFLTRITHESGDGMYNVAIFFWVSKLFGVKRVGGGSGIMFTLALLGQIAGSLVFGPIGQLMGYHVPMIVSGITTIISAFLLLAFVKIFKISDK